MFNRTVQFIAVLITLTLSPLCFAIDYNISDLQGTWSGTWSEFNPSVGAYWIYGSFTVDDSGHITGGTWTTPDGATQTITSGQLSIDSSGIITGTSSTSNGSTQTIHYGKLGPSKLSFTFVDTTTNGNMDIGIFFRSDYSSFLPDFDKDGVIDFWDECPNTPPNSYVDNKGCTSYSGCDVNGDGKIGLEEAIHALRVLSGQAP